MEGPPGPKASDGLERSSSVPLISLSSPCSRPIPRTPRSPSVKNPRWAKQFKLVKKCKENGECPDTFVVKSHASTAYLPLVAVDTTAGNGECLAQTAKQWDTIIKQSKADDKVPYDMKAAKFFHFGHVIRDSRPARPSAAYVFVHRQSEADAEEEINGLPLPLKAYAADRRQKIRLPRRPVPVHLESSHQSVEAPAIIHEPKGDSDVHTSIAQSNSVPKSKGGHDLNFLKFAAEEDLNDYELVRGIGRVPISRKPPEPMKPAEDKPFELLPDAWASRDLHFLLHRMISSDLNINNLMVLPSATIPALDDPEALQFKWNGKTDQSIIVLKGHEIKRVPFKDVTAIKYNRNGNMLLFQFSSAESSKAEELLLILLPVSDTTWQSLQTCCYSLIKGNPSKQRCDMEGQEFFDAKTTALKSLRIKRVPVTQVADRLVAHKGQKARRKPIRPSKPLFQTRINPKARIELSDTTPAKAHSAPPELFSKHIAVPQTHSHASQESSSNLVITPDRQEGANNEECDTGLNQSSFNTENKPEESDLEATTQDPDIEGGNSTTSDVDSQCQRSSPNPTGFYYKSTLKSGTLVPVCLNDLVVRLRSETEREDGGKRDKLDLFDGPWRIVEFNLTENTNGMNLSIEEDRGTQNDPLTLSQHDKAEAKKMLKTNVRLGFPEESHATRSVELSRLLPVTELEHVRGGELHASCWAVAELTQFKKFQSIMANENTQAVDGNISTVIPENLSGKTTNNREGAVDEVDDDIDDEDEEGGDEIVYAVEIKSGIFVAVLEFDPQAADGNNYEVLKLRSKRLRLYKLNSPIVRKHKLKTDIEDPWVKRLIKEVPQLALNRVVVTEYKVHWAGWADEDDNWELGTGNIAKGFVDEYHELTDPLRTLPIDIPLANPKDMVYHEDLPKPGRGRPSGGSSKSTRPSKSANNSRRSTALLAAFSDIDEEDHEKEMLDADEDIAVAKAVQASLDAQAEKTKEVLKDLQKQMGVDPKPSETTDAGNDGFVAPNEPDRDWENDIIMAEGDDDIEQGDGHVGAGVCSDGHEV